MPIDIKSLLEDAKAKEIQFMAERMVEGDRQIQVEKWFKVLVDKHSADLISGHVTVKRLLELAKEIVDETNK